MNARKIKEDYNVKEVSGEKENSKKFHGSLEKENGV